MPRSRQRPQHTPKPWRRDSVFTPPKVQRLSAPSLRAWCGFVHELRREHLISPGRMLVALHLLRLAGWKGRGQITLAELAAGAEVSVDTVGRALNDLTALKLVRRHHLIRRERDGRTVQDATFFELLPAPLPSDPHSADALALIRLKKSFLVRKQWKRWPRLWIKLAPSAGGDDDWGFWNRDLQIEGLAASGAGISTETITAP